MQLPRLLLNSRESTSRCSLRVKVAGLYLVWFIYYIYASFLNLENALKIWQDHRRSPHVRSSDKQTLCMAPCMYVLREGMDMEVSGETRIYRVGEIYLLTRSGSSQMLSPAIYIWRGDLQVKAMCGRPC